MTAQARKTNNDILGIALVDLKELLKSMVAKNASDLHLRSDKPAVFNGYCGAESGSVPVSAVSPAILISEIEIEKKDSGQDLLPLLPSPLTDVKKGASE